MMQVCFVWSAQTRLRFQSADESAHSKIGETP